MYDLLYWAIVFLVSLAVLIKSSEYFTLAAEDIGIVFGIPAFIVGVTIVSLGTSLPELVSSVIAVLEGSPEIVVGNVVGSNIANIFLVLGLAAFLGKKLDISYELIHVDLPLLMGSAFYLGLTLWDGLFTVPEALLGFVGIIIYIAYTIQSQTENDQKSTSKKKLEVKTVLMLVASSVFIYLGADYTIESVVRLSEILQIAKEIIAITAISIGTSLPELLVSISAARMGRAEIAVGNVLGSNIFNSYLILGVPALISPLVASDVILDLALPVMIVATLLYFFMTQDRQITRYEGALLILFYVFFIGKLFGLI
jgi:cation:H+ antiporter